MKKPECFMKLALKEAQKAAFEDEIPVGCIIVKGDRIVARGHNLREKKNLTISHAEIETINKANKKLNSWRLNDCDIYITLEPCLMCMGAILDAHFKTVYFGAFDYKAGAISSLNVLNNKNLDYKPLAYGGILEEECSKLIKDYFEYKRIK